MTRRSLPVRFPCLTAAVALLAVPASPAFSEPRPDEPAEGRADFKVAEHKACVIVPPGTPGAGPVPWVWYAPTLGVNLPGAQEKWMFDRFRKAGVAVAGIDVGESYGSPNGRAAYQALYEELTGERGFSRKPVLLARSRGGLMLYNWAAEHPDCVGAIAGIYPVCNLTSYPGLERAAPAYGMTAEGLREKLADHNPVDRLVKLAEAKVPILHLHGDRDRVVPLEANSALLADRYNRLGGPVEVEVIEGRGHNLWEGWFESRKLTEFVITEALGRGKQ